MSDLRIGFMGTPDFALEALKALYDANKNIVAIYSQPPRPKGRGQRVQNSPVHQFGLDHDIPVFHPVDFKSKEVVAEFAAQKLDIAVVAAYGLLLPEAILDMPTFGCINIHASLLPRWRGASPIQHAIWHDDPQSGVTLMQMDTGLDTGPMLVKQQVPITKHMTSSELHDALCVLSRKMIVEFVTKLEAGKVIESEEQNVALSSYAPLLKKEDGWIDWSKNAAQIDCQIRALNPWPGVWTMLDGQRFKILEARIVESISGSEKPEDKSPQIPPNIILHNSNRGGGSGVDNTDVNDTGANNAGVNNIGASGVGVNDTGSSNIGAADAGTSDIGVSNIGVDNTGIACGTVCDAKGIISCGENTALQILKIQPQGKQAMDFISAVNGGYIKTGDKFS